MHLEKLSKLGRLNPGCQRIGQDCVDASPTEFPVHRAVQCGGRGMPPGMLGMEAGRRADVRVTTRKGFVFLPLLPPAETQPPLLGEPVAAKMTDGCSLFQGCAIMPPAFHGLGPTLQSVPVLVSCWPDQSEGTLGTCHTFLKGPPSSRISPKLEFVGHS